MSPPRPHASGRWPRLEGLVLLLAGVGALGFQLWLPSTHVDEADYRQVAAVLAQEAQPGDAVLLFPWWTERARLYLPGSLPVVGYLGSEADDLLPHPRVWVLGEPRLPLSGQGTFDAAFLPGRTSLGPERRFGNLALSLYANGRHRPLAFSLADRLADARVYLEAPDGSRRPCPFDGRAHACPGGKRLGVEWHEVKFRPLQCLVFDAPGGPTRLVLELPQVPAADRLLLQAGYTGERGAHQRPGVTDSQLGLETDGHPAQLAIPAGVEVLHRLEHPGPHEGDTLRLWLQSDNPHERQVCVVLDAVARSR